MTHPNDDRYQGDVWYEVWRRGGNPDRVDPERISDYRYDGMDVDEAAVREIRRQRPTRNRDEYEECAP